MLMSEIAIITGGGRRWSAAYKLRIMEETMYEGESISAVARRNGVTPNLLYCWRKLMFEGGRIAVAEDNSVTGNKTVREMGASHLTRHWRFDYQCWWTAQNWAVAHRSVPDRRCEWSRSQFHRRWPRQS